MNAKKNRVLTGLQPSGTPQLGNYFGSIRPAIELADRYELFLFIADFHVLNRNFNAPTNFSLGLDLAATLLACGLDPSKSSLYCQSAVPEVTELMWILSCVAPYGLLTRAHSFKDKTSKGEEINCGVFNYPILMAADILLYDAEIVPVGKDQKQHLEMARDMAQRFNHIYGDILTLPEPLISEEVGVVPGTDGEKMSKSKDNIISIFGTDKIWKRQIMSVVTDSKELHEVKDPHSCNVFAIYKLLASEAESTALAERYLAGGMGYGHAKLVLLEKVHELFSPMRDRYFDWSKRPDDICDVLRMGANKVREIAKKKLDQVQTAVGLLGHKAGIRS